MPSKDLSQVAERKAQREITSRSQDFAASYNDLIFRHELVDNSRVRGLSFSGPTASLYLGACATNSIAESR
jgi:hypothetical protein